MSGKVIEMFGAPIGALVAEKVVPRVRNPESLADYQDAGALQLQRDRSVDSIGTWFAVGAALLTFFAVRDWRSKRGKQQIKS